jgi:hypothetical protein
VTRAQLEHIIRAATTIADDVAIVIVGSQSILGQFPDAPEELLVSDEADVFPLNFPERADLIDGCIGEGSAFHDTFGYYAQGVGEETSVLPPGWRERLVPVQNANTRHATGLCLEVHDLVLAKLVAGREKDRRFTAAAARHRLVERHVLMDRLAKLEISEEIREIVASRIAVDFAER